MKDDVNNLLFMQHQIEVLSRYAPEGDVIVAEQLASFTFRITSVTAFAILVVFLGGTTTVIGTDSEISGTINDLADGIVNAINANPSNLNITAQRPATIVGQDGTVTIIAPVGSGASYNGVALNLVVTGANISSFQDPYIFLGGVTQVLADTPCLTDKEARTIYETLDNICGGGCGCSDDNIYKDLIIS